MNMISENSLSENMLSDFIAGKLLKIKAVKFQIENPFDWGIGWSSPVYCDDRKLLSYPSIRAVVKLELARLVAEKYPDADVIAAVASNAVAISVLVADTLGLPFIYVHPEPKDHGFENRIEGDLRPHQKVVILENQVSTGANSVKVAEAIRQNACEVNGLLSIFDYRFDMSAQAFKSIDLEHTSLCNFGSVLRLAQENKSISRADVATLEQWHKNPAAWKANK